MSRLLIIDATAERAKFEASALGLNAQTTEVFTHLSQLLSIGSGTTVILMPDWGFGRKADEVIEIRYRLRIAHGVRGVRVLSLYESLLHEPEVK